jgi:hypothetical protein
LDLSKAGIVRATGIHRPVQALPEDTTRKELERTRIPERGNYAKIRMHDFRSASVSADDRQIAVLKPAFTLKNGL